jgi:hypothetical protein
MNSLQQGLVVASFTVILTSILAVVGFTYLKIDTMDTRLVTIEVLVIEHQGREHAPPRKAEPTASSNPRSGAARNSSGSHQALRLYDYMWPQNAEGAGRPFQRYAKENAGKLAQQ